MTADPLGYPGRSLMRPGSVIGGEFRDDVATERAGRRPVLAVGSNASLPVLRSKLSALPPPVEVPVTAAVVHNIVVGVSAHVSRPGYLPGTPVEAPGVRTRLVVCWFDAPQLAAVDATEPNYERVRLSFERFGVDTDVYVSRHGYLVDADGAARRLTSQRELIAGLLAESKALRDLTGDTPQAFIGAMQYAGTRAAAARIFRSRGWVHPASQFTAERRAGRTTSPN